MPMTIGGQTYSDDQIKQFYANGGDPNQWAQQNGITDLNQIHDLATQSRGIAGSANATGDAAMQNAFKSYQQYNPQGADVNNYQSFVANQDPGRANAIRAGAYSGTFNDAKDYGPGGIYGPGSATYGTAGYASGIGSRGDGANGNAWAGANNSGVSGSNNSGNLGFGSNNSGSYGGGGYGGGSGGGYSSMQSSSSGGLNPYLDQMAGSITNQMQDNYNNNIAPANRSGAMVAGGFGGSRQGVIDSNAGKAQSQALGNSLAGLYGTGWQNAQQNNLQQQSINNGYDLGLRSNNLGFANLDSNNQQFGANYGLNVMNAQNNWANQGVNATTNMQNAPVDYATKFQNNTNQMAGQGGTQTNTQNLQGNPWLGAVSGAQMASQWLK